MSRLLMYGIKQQKRKGVTLGFEPYVAPTGFDRTAQDVDIYDVFNKYYKTNSDAKYIYSVSDTATTTALGYTATSWRYGYTSGGIDYTEDVVSTNTSHAYSFGSYTEIEVVSTAGFPSSGTIYSYNGGRAFIYTSITATKFIGASQTFYAVGTDYIIQTKTITWTGTKRWVIANHYSASAISAVVPSTQKPVWIYCGDLVNNINIGSSNTTCKYIHIHALNNITAYSPCVSSGLTGNLYLSRNGSCTFLPAGAFQFNTGIVGTLTIPSNITTLSAGGAFWGCTGLTGLVFEEGLTSVTSAFYGCTNIQNDIILPDSLVTVDRTCFANCSKIPSVTFGNAVTTIKYDAFVNCTGITGELTFPSTLITIEYNAFKSCNHITSINWGGNETTIQYSAFQNCTALTGTWIVPNSVTTIGELAFSNCTGYSGTLTIPSGITSLGEGAFYLDNFNAIDVSSNAGYHSHDSVLYQESTHTAIHSLKAVSGTITFENDTIKIGNYCCGSNARTGAIIIPSSVTSIGSSSFLSCSGLTSLSFTATPTITSIGNSAFKGTGVTGTITIPDSVTIIDISSFDGVGITGLVLGGSSLTTIGARAFFSCPLTGTVTIPNSVTTLGNNTFAYITSSVAFVLGTGITTMDFACFFVSTGITSFTGGSTNFVISDNVIYDLRTSGQIKAISSALGYVGSLTLRADTTSIGRECFYGSYRTGTLTIPSLVTSIESAAFYNSSGFTRCDSYRSTAPTVATNGLTLGGTARPLHIPAGGGTGYGVAPWTTAAIFTQPAIDDL